MPALIRSFLSRSKDIANGINLPLLVFLLLFLNVKLVIKFVALLLIYILNPNFKFRFKLKNSRLPLFYPGIIILAILTWIISARIADWRYDVVVFTGLLFWVACILAIHQIKLAVENTPSEKLHKTINLFFLINAFVSFADILFIIFKIHRINPYTYQGHFQEYFLNTGDYIKGITFDVAITNSVIAAFGVIYSLVRQNFKMLMLCMAVLLLSASNTVNILLFVIIGLIFLLMTNRVQKSMIVVCLTMTVIFMAKISPQNMYYVAKMYNKVVFNRNISFDPLPINEVRVTDIPDAQLTPERRKEKIALLFLDSLNATVKQKNFSAKKIAVNIVPAAIAIPKDSIHTATFQPRSDTDAAQRKLLGFVSHHQAQLPLSAEKIPARLTGGKLLAFRQTAAFLISHPIKLLLGNGIGNFSSKLAFKTTGLGVAGGYPTRLVRINPDFMHNHLDLYLNFFSRRTGMHSVLNSPDAVYDQLAGEYGLAGLILFAICYVCFFLKRYKQLTYGLPLLLLTCGVFLTDYWFEQLSIVVLLELLLFTDLKDHSLKRSTA